MNRTLSCLIAAALALVASSARAQSDLAVERASTGGTHKAFEISLGLGYSQGFGDVGTNMPNIGDVGAGGGTAELGLGYRFNPSLLVGVYAGASRYAQGSKVTSGDVCGYQAGVQGNWHFNPTAKLDPWIGVGAGWRMFCLNQDAGNATMHGLDLGRINIGVDYQVTPTFALAPVIGASINLMLTQKGAAVDGFSNITDPKPNLFFFGGVMGRFDLFGQGPDAVRIASR